MNKKNQAKINNPHIRYWKLGQISSVAKERIDILLICGRPEEARSMAAEWIIDIERQSNEQPI
jgi:hypothetical protein